ncbi:MAG TPA: methyltransferase domain-containing protein [Alphaproteobacteria bacterium]|nr:methyltransferase domain-containing protein [Alphaproteobacteria bacterium]
MELWRDFWNRANRVYVNDRHRAVHYRQVADDILSVLPPRPCSILDFGCGEALDARRVAARAARLYLYDSSDRVGHGLAARFAGDRAIVVLDDEAYAALAPASLDRVVVNSVIQYLSEDELRLRLADWRRLLKADGVLVLADVIPPDAGMAADVSSLLTTAWRHGFLAGALAGLAATLFSDYRRVRGKIGLSTYDEQRLTKLLQPMGFAIERRPVNFGFNARRRTYFARMRP